MSNPTRRRDRSIERVGEILQRAGFFVSDAHAIRPTSFDLLARRDSLLLIVKILKNIDALDAAEAARLRELGELFPASAVVVGETSGGAPLEGGVVYGRYGVSVVTEETFSDLLLEGVPPFLFSSPGGIFGRLDGVRLRGLREARALSLGALASVAGVSRRTIQLYEEGGGAEVDVIERLERYLGEAIALPITLWTGERAGRPRLLSDLDAEAAEETTPAPRAATDGPPGPTGDRLRDFVFRQLDATGWEVVVTLRCPFDAFTHADARGEKEILLTSVGSWKTALHRAELLSQLARVAEGHALYVVRDAPERSVRERLPVLTMRELRRQRDPDDLLETIEGRVPP
ncbi:MAG TPA: helix-turn-helix domain-containing protein [Thermoplasmata archaeon]|nr:helix-turn-helix domain-containing protein [Thermoplasmata archaeon]